MLKADQDPAQAEADMQRLQAAASKAESARDDAQEHADRVERDMDTAFAAGDDIEVARLSEHHQRAEITLEAAEREFESAMGEIGEATTFWFEEDED